MPRIFKRDVELLPRHIDLFWAKVCKLDNGCWIWRGSTSKNGYGGFSFGPRHDCIRRVLVHRLAYELLVGPIPDGLQLDHLCRNRLCVNPAHLEPVTCQVNILRGNGFAARNAKKTHCLRGHELTEETVVLSRAGERNCRLCHRERHRAYRERKRAKAYAPSVEA